MSQRSAIVTGASGVVGTALCEAFASAGHRVIAIDRRRSDVTCDVFVQRDIQDLCGRGTERDALLDEVRGALAGASLAALVNNAAVQWLGSVQDITADKWVETFEVNVQAPFTLVQAMLPELEAAHGTVINIASVHANLTKPGFVLYATSKAALVGLTRALAVDLGGRVRVNAILPAAIDSPMLRAGFNQSPSALDELAAMHPSGRLGSPEEVARLAVFIASTTGSLATGGVWNLDGGIGARLHDPA